MSDANRDALRERNRRRGNCPKCGGDARELSAAEVARREDMFAELRYAVCVNCGNEWRLKGAAKIDRPSATSVEKSTKP